MLLVFLMAAASGPSVTELDSLAKARDVAKLSGYIENLPEGGFNPLTVIRTNGAYECGKFGWRALEMKSPDNDDAYVVLSTPLTGEDVGEVLLKRDGAKLRLIPEEDAMDVQVVKHTLDVRFSIPDKSAAITDRLQLRTKGDSDFVFRMTPEFQVSAISTASGKNVKFAQAGGVVLLAKPAAGEETFTISYKGAIDRPLYSGSIEASEATLANCYWYPMIARQPAPYQVTVHYPPDWISVGQGAKVHESPGETTWQMNLPCVYYSLSAGPYKRGEYKAGSRSFYGWSPRSPIAALVTQAETYPPIVQFYERFAPFPFQSYGGLDSPHYGGGALEAYSYATYGGGFPYVDAHEPSHTWWGGIVDNTYLHSFWNESFAVYSDELFHREWTGTEGNRLAFIPEGEVSPAYDLFACSTAGADHGPAASDLGYGKGSHVLYMLEKLIGLDSMVKSMHRFIKDQPVGKAAEWEDFERAAEAENPSTRLESFFQDWLDRPGHLEFTAAVSYQDGGVAIDYRPANPFRIPLEVLLRYPDGKSETRILEVRDAGVYKIASPTKPSLVSLDPYRFLIRPIAADEKPLQIQSAKAALKISLDPAHPDWGPTFGQSAGSPTTVRNGTFFVGSPESLPAIADLFEKVGFKVSGNNLTYHNKTIDLNHGAAEAVIDLGDGVICGIGLGKTRIPLDPGAARVGIFDDLGRLIDGEVEPKLKGALTFKL